MIIMIKYKSTLFVVWVIECLGIRTRYKIYLLYRDTKIDKNTNTKRVASTDI